MKICGVEITGIKKVSTTFGDEFENEIHITIDSSKSQTILAVQHVQFEDTVVEFKEFGPFVFFAMFPIEDLIAGRGRGGIGSKYLDVPSGGWSSRCDVINQLGVYDPLYEVIVDRSLMHLTGAAIECIAAEFGVELDLNEYGFKKTPWAEVEATQTIFANHGGL